MKAEEFNEQMAAEGLTPEAQINEIMATLPPIYYAGKGGYAIEHKGGFIPLPSETQVKQHLAMAGVTKELMTPIVCRIRTDNFVCYIGPVAGQKPGLHRSLDSGQSYLVTHGPKIIEAREGETLFLGRLFDGFVGTGLQRQALIAWLRQARRNVVEGTRRPLPAAIFMGPVNGCKTLMLDITRAIVGGRAASAFPFLAGKTQFNGDIIGAELLTVDDEIAHADHKARTSFGQAIKRDLFASSVRMRRMYHEALDLRPVQLLAIAVNNEPEHLQVLPAVDNTLRDKISLFWCGKGDLGGLTNRGEIWKRIEGELPAFCHYLDSTEHPEILRHPRTGCAAWQSLEALEAMQAISAEERLVELISQSSEVMAEVNGSGKSKSEGWRGTSTKLESILLEDPMTFHGAKKLFYWPGACGSTLSKLERSGRIDISSTTVQGNRTWTIKNLQRVKAQEEDSAEAYSVRGWSGGPKSDFYKQEGEEKDNTVEKRETTPTSPPPEGGAGAEVPEEVPTPPLNPPRTPAVPAWPAEDKNLRRQWVEMMARLKTETAVPDWLQDPAEVEMQGRNLIAAVNLTPETEAEFYLGQGDLSTAVEECWLAVTGQSVCVSIGMMPEPAAPTVQTVSTTMNPEGLQHETRSDDVGKRKKRPWEECIAELGGDDDPNCIGVRRSGGGKR